MSAPTEASRSGVALLLAVAVTAVVGLCTLALWKTSAGSSRSLVLERARARADALASEGTARALQQVSAGAWRTLSVPASTRSLGVQLFARGQWRADLGRPTWSTLIIRTVSDAASGAPGVRAMRDERVLVPLLAPLDIPSAALTGARPWSIPVGAAVDVPLPSVMERRCRDGIAPVPSRTTPRGGTLQVATLAILDADTVTRPVVGSYRLARASLRSPLQVTGMVALDSDLVVQADLQLTGVLFVRGSIRHAGGRLDVTGAIVAGDSLGGNSGLGTGDRVRYDACAIRHAVDLVTRPGPSATWTRMSPF